VATLLDRVRRGLAPEYDVRQELAHGGMGVVFVAYDTILDRQVAVKVIRPEIATATAVERFVREARLLAGLNHPNVVPVHRAGEVDGIAYYVMEHIGGETLAERLRRGPLAPPEALKLGRDLLDALEAVHRHGVVHRDVKPSNIFLLGGRALLADFGVARSEVSGPGASTEAGALVGTPGYMSPEQVSGEPATEQSDLYSAAVVLYEAYTGRPMEAPKPAEEADWHGVPRRLVPILRRGIAWSADARWPDASAFRHALWATRKRPYQQRTMALTVAGVLVGAGVAYVASLRGAGGGTPELFIEPFAVTDPGPAWLGDSVARLLARELAGNPDFVARGPDHRSDARPDALVRGTIETRADSTCTEVRVEGLVRTSHQVAVGACAPAGELDALAERLAHLVLLEIWTGDRAIITELPRGNLPRDSRAITAFLEGERAFSRARWGEALVAYAEAEAIDSTCSLCSWRLYDVQRWQALPHDPRQIRRFVRAADSFPPHYQSLLRAPGVPIAARLDTLLRASQRHFQSALVWWSLGEELFHRGPLVGHARREAIEAFERSAELRSDFAPAWEHLAWAYTAEGDSAGADSALARWLTTMGGQPSDAFTINLRALVETGFAWRCTDAVAAEGRLRVALRTPEIAGSPLLPLAPRLLPTFDALDGVLSLGREFARDPRSHFQRSGLIALVFGFVALGRPDSAEARLRQLAARFPDEELHSFAAQLPAVLAFVDPEGGWRGALPAIRQRLQRLAGPGTNRTARQRANWALSVLAVTQPEPAERLRSAWPTDMTWSQRAVLDATLASLDGRWRDALDRLDPIPRDSVPPDEDPTLPGVVRLLRAEWLDRSGNPDAARRELRWAEHDATFVSPTGPPQTTEVDWSLRTLARWRRARLLDRAGEADWEVCASYTHVARDWAGGVPVYAARADTARQRLEALACPRRQ
jgi:serine/threonine protein kinase/tetratricopeptide (TPR) repeat protein